MKQAKSFILVRWDDRGVGGEGTSLEGRRYNFDLKQLHDVERVERGEGGEGDGR